ILRIGFADLAPPLYRDVRAHDAMRSLVARCTLTMLCLSVSPLATAGCPGSPDLNHVCAAPVVLQPPGHALSAWQNLLTGPNRFQSTSLDGFELIVGVYPSPDSDLVTAFENEFGSELTQNGGQTSVIGYQPAIANPAIPIPFSGLAAGRGYGWG